MRVERKENIGEVLPASNPRPPANRGMVASRFALPYLERSTEGSGDVSQFGALTTALAATIGTGNTVGIATVCERLVPFMAITYVAGCLVILSINRETIPGTLELIFRSAFTGHAAVGGFLDAGMREAIRYGIARGLFSNESGLGSAPIVAAAAQTKNPVRKARR